jgi:hypothetical protein
MTEAELKERLENSPALAQLQNQLQSEVSFRMDKSIQFSPLLIISLISVLIQVLTYCREHRNTDELRLDMRELRALPARKLIRLRRKLKDLWRNTCADDTLFAARNPLLEAVYELSDSADDAIIDELLWLAERNKPLDG